MKISTSQENKSLGTCVTTTKQSRVKTKQKEEKTARDPRTRESFLSPVGVQISEASTEPVRPRLEYAPPRARSPASG
ncbi:hypothetical protein KFK09_021321 [Dendrobium nobile]|uniref:Uncharacterized protein n=1 Tax=Dendrobium nobile TaxID=94219 RepID=A0A8T3APP0_DENNO|nr:hypothetical protein KFK09_021321 [Dendrobium nobile]